MTRWFDNEHPGLRRFWHPVAAIDGLLGDGPHPIRLLGEEYVAVRLDDRWRVLPGVCPHRLAPLAAGSIVGESLQCSYHGWCFDADGVCVDIPAIGDSTVPPTAHLQSPASVAERYGLLWVALDEPLNDIPAIPEWEDEAFGLAVVPPQTWNSSAAQMADNFLDVAHFPFTHLGTIGDPDDREVGDYEVARDGWTFNATHRHRSKVLDDAAAGEQERYETFERTMKFRCDAPHHVRLYIDYGEAGPLVLMFFHQPVDRDRTTLYCFALAVNIADGRMRPEDHIAFQTEVAREDRQLLEQLRVNAIPLDPGVETHTRADKITVELRRLLNDIDQL